MSLGKFFTTSGMDNILNEQGIKLKVVQVGIGVDCYTEEDKSITSLKQETKKFNITGSDLGDGNYEVHLSVPRGDSDLNALDEPNFSIKEMGLFLEDGTMLAYFYDSDGLGFRTNKSDFISKIVIKLDPSLADSLTINLTDDYIDELRRDFNEVKEQLDEIKHNLGHDIAGVIVPPVGAIMMYNGDLSDLANNWALCDGTRITHEGTTTLTPDLRDKFIIGSSSSKPKGSIGGSFHSSARGGHGHSGNVTVNGHTLSKSELPATRLKVNQAKSITVSLSGNPYYHLHALSIIPTDRGYDRSNDFVYTEALGSNHAHSHSGSMSIRSTGDHSHEVMPPYYSLAFIMRVF